MSYKPKNGLDIKLLEDAVIHDEPDEVKKLIGKLGNIKTIFTARALGLACRFRGLDMVKTLVTCGADFRHSGYEYLMLLNDDEAFSGHTSAKEIQTERGALKILPPEERLPILEYLLENSDKTGFQPPEFLCYSIMLGDLDCYRKCKEAGVKFSRKIYVDLIDTHSNMGFYNCFIRSWSLFDCGKFLQSAELVCKEIGGALLKYENNFFMHFNSDKFLNPEAFEFIITHFDKSRMNRKKIMQYFIDNEAVECLAKAEKYGWLKLPKKRDELINYAADNKKAESAAWLLEFRNRTADLEAERIKAEKKIERELNADPNSITELKKIWKYERRINGIVITGYKGKNGIVAVPEKIGNDTVIAIGEYAFSPQAKHIHEDSRTFRENSLTSVTLPEGITSIGEGAFLSCRALKYVNFPDSLEEIQHTAFSGCGNLSGVKLPKNIKYLGASAFAGCSLINEIDIPQKIDYIYDLTFSLCSGLAEVNIPPNVTSIGLRAFQHCTSLRTVTISEGVQEIKSFAFFGCSALETITFPESLKKIINGKTALGTVCAFADSPKLTAKVVKGTYAEKYCKRNNLNFVYISKEA